MVTECEKYSCNRCWNRKLTCCSSSGPQAPWHYEPGTSWSQWAACTWSSCCYHNQCWASASGPWTACVPCCQYLWVCASFSIKMKQRCQHYYKSNSAQTSGFHSARCRQCVKKLTAIFTYLSDWWRMNFLVLFLTILGFVRGLRAAMVTESRNIKLRLQSIQHDIKSLMWVLHIYSTEAKWL